MAPRITHLTSVHHPFDTRIFYKEIKSLAAAGYDVSLVAPHHQDETVDTIPVRAVPPTSGKLQRILVTGWRVMRAAVQENADVYHIHDPELLVWSQVLRWRGRTVIYDVHENIAESIRHKTWIHPLLRPLLAGLYRLLERILTRNMPLILAETSYAPDYRWHRGPQTVILNMPLANQLLAMQQTPAPQPTVGYVGDVKPWRGSRVTLEALALLKQRGLSVAWECVGQMTEAHRQEMMQFIRQHDLQGVRLHGRLRPEQWHPLMARCHIGLAVLADHPNYVSSYPTKLFEYMALGLPVITSGFPLYREIVDGAGCGLTLNHPDDAHELAGAIDYLLQHPQEAAAMGQRGRQAVQERFRWDVEAQKLVDFYAQVLEANP